MDVHVSKSLTKLSSSLLYPSDPPAAVPRVQAEPEASEREQEREQEREIKIRIPEGLSGVCNVHFRLRLNIDSYIQCEH